MNCFWSTESSADGRKTPVGEINPQTGAFVRGRIAWLESPLALSQFLNVRLFRGSRPTVLPPDHATWLPLADEEKVPFGDLIGTFQFDPSGLRVEFPIPFALISIFPHPA